MRGDVLALRFSTFCTSGFSGAQRGHLFLAQRMHRWLLGIGGCVPRLAPGKCAHAKSWDSWSPCSAVGGSLRRAGRKMEFPAVVRAEDERERAQILAQGAPMELARCRLQVT